MVVGQPGQHRRPDGPRRDGRHCEYDGIARSGAQHAQQQRVELLGIAQGCCAAVGRYQNLGAGTGDRGCHGLPICHGWQAGR